MTTEEFSDEIDFIFAEIRHIYHDFGGGMHRSMKF